MNKKALLTFAPAFIVFSALVGCKNTTKEYTVKFDTDGGTAIADVKVKEGNKVARPSTDPVKKDYTFTDWYTTKDGNDKFNFDNVIKNDLTIFAHYTSATKEVEGIAAKLKVVKEYKVGETITKNDITVTATYKDKSTADVSDWTCKDIKDDTGYTFTKEDAEASQKQFEISYGGKETIIEVGVIEGEPEFSKYMDFVIIDETTNVKVKKKNIVYETGTELTIPETVDGKYVTDGVEGTTYTVTEVAADAFQYIEAITKVVLPKTITKIGTYAFNGCKGLSNITLNEGLIEISNYTFNGCDSLTSITLPSTLQTIGIYAFAADKIANIIIPSSVTSIGKCVFGDSPKTLASIEFNDIVTKWTISGSPETEWKPSAITSENANTFKNNTDKSFTKQDLPKIPKGLEFGGVVKGSTNKTYLSASGDAAGSVAIPYAVDGKDIKQGATEGKAYAVTEISAPCFEANESITEIKIPETMEVIEEGAFESCENLATIIFDGNIASTIDEESGIFEYATTVKVKTGIDASTYITTNFTTVTTEAGYNVYSTSK